MTDRKHIDKSARTTDRQYPVRRNLRLPSVEYRQGYIFFITIGVHQRYQWFKAHPDLAQACITLLRDLATNRKSTLFAYCIMPDHIHILIEDLDIVEYVRLFKGTMTPLARKKDPTRQLWQRSFYDHAVRQEESVYNIALYIWENPVRARIVDSPKLYTWSGSEVWPDFRTFYE